MLDCLTVDLSRRLQEPERMDDRTCDLDKLHRTLQQFDRINRWFSRYRTLMQGYILPDMEQEPDRTYHLVDLGTGAGDIPRWLLRQARNRGLKLHVTGLDSDPRVIQWARDHCKDAEGLTLRQQDVTDLRPLGQVDYVFANHLLHHLPTAEIQELFEQVAALKPRAFVLSDLHRQRSAYLGFSLYAGFCLHRSFVYTDGRQSIRRGFVPAELRELLARGPLDGKADIVTLAPGRIAVVSTSAAAHH